MTHHEAPAAIAMQEVVPMRRNHQFMKSADRELEHSTNCAHFDVLMRRFGMDGEGERQSQRYMHVAKDHSRY